MDPSPGGFAGNKNPMLNDNLSRIVRWYKGWVSFECRNFHSGFTWQTRFYDHIVRDNEELSRIRSYIIDNPLKWKEDKFYI
jgi:REP element-mobilizing transposase RayT